MEYWKIESSMTSKVPKYAAPIKIFTLKEDQKAFVDGSCTAPVETYHVTLTTPALFHPRVCF